MEYFNYVVVLDPMIEYLSELEIGSIALTCKINFINMKSKINSKFRNSLKFYLGSIESDYRLSFKDKNFLNWIKHLVTNEMQLFPKYYSVLYDDIKDILEKYSDKTSKDIIILTEFHKK